MKAGSQALQEASRRSDWRKVLKCLDEADKNGEKLTPIELSARTGLSIDAVRGSLTYLEAHGLAE